MKITIEPSSLKGTIQAPASKSSMQRACAAALLSRSTVVIHQPGHSNDDKAAMDIIQRLGASIERKDESLVVRSKGVAPVSDAVNCGESGLSIRMFTPIAALADQPVTITGEGSLVSRPMNFFDEVLPRLGVEINSTDGRLPLTVKGPLTPVSMTVDGSLSSQFLTGLLMAYSAAGATNVTLTVDDLKSKPYIDLTLDVMKQFGMRIPENRSHREFVFQESEEQSVSEEIHYTVEGDWSGGAFLLVAGAIAGPILVNGLDPASTQADKAILDALMLANASMAIEAKGIRMRPDEMNAFEFDATDCPDLFPPLVALAAYCNGVSKIKGVSRLAHKESDRATALQDEFDAMGVVIDIEGDFMHIHGGKGVRGADVHSHHDHRIAMACAVAALRADSETTIEDAQAIDKSYPDFFNDLRLLGASVSSDTAIKLL